MKATKLAGRIHLWGGFFRIEIDICPQSGYVVRNGCSYCGVTAMTTHVRVLRIAKDDLHKIEVRWGNRPLWETFFAPQIKRAFYNRRVVCERCWYEHLRLINMKLHDGSQPRPKSPRLGLFTSVGIVLWWYSRVLVYNLRQLLHPKKSPD